MYTLARENPLAAVLCPQFQDFYCATCFAELDVNGEAEILMCDDCSEVSYCSLKCQRKDWRSVHQFECEILRTQNNQTPMTTTMRLCIRTLLVTLRNSERSPSFNGAIIEDLETNYKEFRSSPSHNQFLSDLVTIIKSVGHNVFPKSVETNKMIAIICTVLCNSFGIIDDKRVEPIGSGLFVGLAKHNHSCASTSHVVFEKNQVLLRGRDMDYCKSTTISYVSRMLPTFERQKSIRSVHFITCRCEMCRNDDLDFIGLASRCQTVNCSGYVKGSDSCGVCKKPAVIPIMESASSTSKLIDILDNLHKSNEFDCTTQYDYLQNLRKEYIRILADCNVAILQLDEQIAYCASDLKKIPDDLTEIAVRGCQHFIDRLGIGALEVTRRLYIACKCLSLLPSSPSSEIHQLAIQSSILSHGEDHSITKYLNDLTNGCDISDD
ncbi:CRE-SET-10 protein [Caenorhabditis remanei]|uniref:CRE-SET-10 protein n=1 Tax=Caenorhabditis remanei TaxID=31234 RepID=E3MFC5_CAERE|nr:CRE-SET-10 protein [Caenorhabditis remanei]